MSKYLTIKMTNTTFSGQLKKTRDLDGFYTSARRMVMCQEPKQNMNARAHSDRGM